MTKLSIVNIICIKWGTCYDAKSVNLLYAMVKRHVQAHAVRFFCFTENANELHPDIIIQPLPIMHLTNPNDLKYGYLKEAGLCDDYLAGLNGQRVFFFDLDVIITGNLDPMLSFPQSDDFVIIKDWNSKGNRVGQATCYSWQVGTLGFIKKDFENRPKEIIQEFYTASQAYLSSKVIEKWGALIFWPESWCRSFKIHALPRWYLRRWIEPRLPQDTILLAFHGHPKMADAIVGQWGDAKIPWLKRVYKTIRPTPWIMDHWKE